MIGAILRAQWLSMRPRTGMRQRGAIFSALTGAAFYGFWLVAGLAVMTLFAQPERGEMQARVAGLLMLVTLYWQVAPVVSASFGASLDLRKLLVYPVPREKLFTVEVLLRVTGCAEMLVVVSGAVAGVARNPDYGPGALWTGVLGAAAFTAVNVLLSAGARNLLERLFVRTRFKELAMLLLVLLVMTPQLMLMSNVKRVQVLDALPSQIGWLWGAGAGLMLGDGRGAVVLAVYLAVAYAFARWQFGRAMRLDEAPAERSAAAVAAEERQLGWMEGIYRLPGRLLADPVAALVEKELRTMARIPRVRFVYAMSCFFGIIIYLPVLRGMDRGSFYIQNALPVMGLYGLLMLGQVSYWNSFGFDKSAAQGYYWWPVRFRDVLVAKNLAVLVAVAPQIAAIALVAAAFRLPVTAAKLAEVLVVIPVTALYWFTFGNYFSVRTPRAMDANKMNQMSNKLQALTIWTAPVTLLPIGLAYAGRAVFGSEWVFAGVMGIAAVVGAVTYGIGLESVEQLAYRKREDLLTQLGQGGGPLSYS